MRPESPKNVDIEFSLNLKKTNSIFSIVLMIIKSRSVTFTQYRNTPTILYHFLFTCKFLSKM